MTSIDLGGIDAAFTRGGNRLCFVDPRDDNRCVKILRPDRTPEIRRKQKGYLKRWRSLASFDENLEEYKVWRRIESTIGEAAFSLISRCFGFVDTNYGKGLVMELIRDRDKRISMTLKQYLWERGFTEELRRTLQQFESRWKTLAMPSKKLLLHNMLLQHCSGGDLRIVVIDGLGWSSWLPLAKYSQTIARRRSTAKLEELRLTIDSLIDNKQQGGDFGYHGWLDDGQRLKASGG